MTNSINFKLGVFRLMSERNKSLLKVKEDN